MESLVASALASAIDVSTPDFAASLDATGELTDLGCGLRQNPCCVAPGRSFPCTRALLHPPDGIQRDATEARLGECVPLWKQSRAATQRHPG